MGAGPWEEQRGDRPEMMMERGVSWQGQLTI